MKPHHASLLLLCAATGAASAAPDDIARDHDVILRMQGVEGGLPDARLFVAAKIGAQRFGEIVAATGGNLSIGARQGALERHGVVAQLDRGGDGGNALDHRTACKKVLNMSSTAVRIFAEA